jgi:protein-tyrosine phosphatase
MSPRISVSCAPNFRDLGGLQAADGRRVFPGRLFRSEVVLQPGAEDTTILRALGVRLVVDLRSPGERSLAPNAWWQAQGAELLDLPLSADPRGERVKWDVLAADMTATGAAALMRSIYAALPAMIGPAMGRLFDAVAEGSVPLLVHCTAGKDRTGVVSALLLHALGVGRAHIYDDYLESARWPNPRVTEATRTIVAARLGRAVDDVVMVTICGVDRAYLDTFFATAESEWGSLDLWLEQEAGLTETKRRRLRDRLLT